MVGGAGAEAQGIAGQYGAYAGGVAGATNNALYAMGAAEDPYGRYGGGSNKPVGEINEDIGGRLRSIPNNGKTNTYGIGMHPVDEEDRLQYGPVSVAQRPWGGR